MKKLLFPIPVILFSWMSCAGQGLGSEIHPFLTVYDTTYGIQFYDKYNSMLGGDLVRKYADGHLCNGEIEDFYPDKKVLHKGYYTNGKLTQYTNYYPNKEIERIFKPTSDRKTELKKYYSSKILKSDVLYYEGNPNLWQDYYPNGQLSYLEEYDKKHERVLRRCSYYKDGKPLSLLLPKEENGNVIRYSMKEYFAGGQLQEESEAIYIKESFDFLKDGDDKQYDEKGNLIAEYEYIGGKINNTIK